MTPSRILVTGATGFIGSRLCEMLSLHFRIPYRALVRDFSRAARIARFEPELVAGDMADAASLARAVDGCDAVVNLAHGDDAAARKQTTQLIEACTRAGVKRLVHVSSMAVHGPTPGHAVLDEANAPIRRWGEAYSDAKAAAEALVTAAGKRGVLDTVVLRPTIVYGPYSFFVTPIIQDARNGFVSLIDGGSGICNAVYVDDVCEAIMAALARDDANGRAFLINGDDRITWQEFITTFADMVEGEKRIHDHPLEDIAAHARARQPRARDSLKAVVRLAASPEFHAQLSTIPPIGKLIRGSKERVSAAISPERKLQIKSRFQGRRIALPERTGPSVPMPSQGRVVREAYRSWVSNAQAKACLDWTPAHAFRTGAHRTADWLRFARMI
jgi:dihydroflavonol-4-reductase